MTLNAAWRWPSLLEQGQRKAECRVGTPLADAAMMLGAERLHAGAVPGGTARCSGMGRNFPATPGQEIEDGS